MIDPYVQVNQLLRQGMGIGEAIRLLDSFPKTSRKADRTDIQNIWCGLGCPKKLVIHTGNRVIALEEGKIVSDISETPKRPRKINNLQPQNGGSGYVTPPPKNGGSICASCRRPFTPTRKWQKYCSPRCSQAAKRRRNAA